MQTGLALGVETGDPAMGALAGDPHRPGDMSDRHLLVTDALHQQHTTVECQAGVTVTHEDLRLVKTAISTAPGVFVCVNDQSPTSWPGTPSTGSSRACRGR